MKNPHFSTFNLTKKLFEPFRIIVWFNNNKTNVYSSCRSDSFHFRVVWFCHWFFTPFTPAAAATAKIYNLHPNNRSQYYISQLTLSLWMIGDRNETRTHACRRRARERERVNDILIQVYERTHARRHTNINMCVSVTRKSTTNLMLLKCKIKIHSDLRIEPALIRINLWIL